MTAPFPADTCTHRLNGEPMPEIVQLYAATFDRQEVAQGGARAGKTGRSDQRVYTNIKAMLLDNLHAPSQQINVASMADRLCVSPTPVREALSLLAAESLLVRIPSRGFFTKPFDLEELRGMLVVMKLLLRHSIESWSGRDHRLSHALLREVRSRPTAPQAGPPPKATEPPIALVEEVLRHVGSLARNEPLAAVVCNYIERSRYIRLIELGLSDRGPELVENAMLIMKYLDSNDKAGAADVLDRLITDTQRNLPALVKEAICRTYVA